MKELVEEYGKVVISYISGIAAIAVIVYLISQSKEYIGFLIQSIIG
ncbi:hypothetical protein [Anaerosporobacter sp.]|nr:hypothetical protein [Anaerosporobacter sp.]